jgi:hypothetical protein
LEINDKKYDLGIFNNGDEKEINLTFSFKNSICIEIWEDDPDFLDGDDHLGDVCPDYDDKSANSAINESIKYGMGNTKYILTYQVF